MALAPAERCHADDVRVLGQRLLEGRPSSFQPSLGTELLGLGVLDRVAKESPVERKNACALGDEVPLEPVVGLGFVGNT